MKKILSFLMLALALALSLPALAEDVLYTGMVTRAMTIREKKSTSAKKLGSVEEGEFISIIDYGEKWTRIEKDGKAGYVLTKNVVDLALAEGYNDAADAQYLGVATKELTIRGSQLSPHCFARTIESLTAGELVTDGIVSHVFPLEDWQKAYEMAQSGKALKVVLVP